MAAAATLKIIRVINVYLMAQKTAQSLWHHNFATVCHSVMRFSAECFDRKKLFT